MKIIIRIILLLSISFQSHGQWKKSIIEGSDPLWPVFYGFVDFTSIGDTIFAVTGRGYTYFSIKNSNIWKRCPHSPPTGEAILALDSYLFVASSKTIFRSDNRGESWEKLDGSPGYVRNLATNDSLIFAPCDGNTGINYWGGVYKSSDYGVTWDSIYEGLPESGVYSIAAKGSKLFVGNRIGQLFISANYGESWTQSGLFDHNSGETLYDIEYMNSCLFTIKRGTMYRSFNFGQTWNLPEIQRNIHRIDSKDSTIVAITYSYEPQVFLSLNNGEDWKDVTHDLPPPRYSDQRWRGVKIIDDRIYVESPYNGLWSFQIPQQDPPEKTEPQKFSLYPNPTKRFLNISLDEPEDHCQIKIYDYFGRLIHDEEYFSSDGRIYLDLAHLRTGNYIVSIILDNQILNRVIHLNK